MKLVLLDRDGVINFDSEAYVKSPEEWQPIPGSLEAIAKLNKLGIKVAIVSNQSGVGRGLFSENTLAQIHDKIHTLLSEIDGKLDHIYYCPHVPNANCDCRKPKPGMVLQALSDFNIAPEDTCFVGDSFRDLEAAIAANCKPILVLTGNGQKALKENDLTNIDVFDDLQSFVNTL